MISVLEIVNLVVTHIRAANTFLEVLIHEVSVQRQLVNRIQINLFNNNAFARLASQCTQWPSSEWSGKGDLRAVPKALTDVFYRVCNSEAGNVDVLCAGL